MMWLTTKQVNLQSDNKEKKYKTNLKKQGACNRTCNTDMKKQWHRIHTAWYKVTYVPIIYQLNVSFLKIFVMHVI